LPIRARFVTLCEHRTAAHPGRPVLRRPARAGRAGLVRTRGEGGLPDRPTPSHRGSARGDDRVCVAGERRPARQHPGLRSDRDRARGAADPHPRRHAVPHRRMGHPAGPQPDHGPRRTGRADEVHDPRPRDPGSRAWTTP